MSSSRSKSSRDNKATETLKTAVAAAMKEKSAAGQLKVRFQQHQEMEDPYANEVEEATNKALETKQQDDAEARKVMWRKALDEAGVPFASKGTKAYSEVMKIFNRIHEEESPAIKLWNHACKEEGVTWAKKGTEEYYRVKSRFDYMKKRAGELKDPFDFSDF